MTDFQCDVATARRLLAGELSDWPQVAQVSVLAFKGFSREAIQSALGLGAEPEKTTKTIRTHVVQPNGTKKRWF